MTRISTGSKRRQTREKRRKKAIGTAKAVGRQVVGINQAVNQAITNPLRTQRTLVKKAAAAGIGLFGKKKKKSPGKKGPGGGRY